MQFTPRTGGNTFWRGDYQSSRRADRPPQNREWSSSWNTPKTFFNSRPKYQYRGPNARGYHKSGNSHWGPNGNRQNSNFRGNFQPDGARGRQGWRKPQVNYSSNNKNYQSDDHPRWRSPPRRRASPLRARENESPRRPSESPRRPSESPRRSADGSPRPSDAKRARLSRSADRSPGGGERSAGKENAEQAPAAGPRRFYGDGAAASPRLAAASQQMRPPPSPRKSGEAGKALQLYGGKAQASRDLQLLPAICGAAGPDEHGTDPLYIGLPNYGNSCYQNATLQSLLGLRPFLNEMMSLISGLEGDSCSTLRAVAKLMVLRQKALSKSVSNHLNDLRDVFANIDPAFRGTEMQDANEFLLRLLDTMKDEVDARRPAVNPVRDNFQYQTIESYMCTKCHETVLKRQENISWFVSVPRRQGAEAPTLQDALRLSMRPDRRELLCQHCRHDECHVTTKISHLPRTLILQLNRYVFLGEESKKIRANVGIPKFLSLNEYVADDVTRPPEWNCTKLSLSSLPDEPERPERPSAPSPPLPPPPPPASPAPATAPAPASLTAASTSTASSSAAPVSSSTDAAPARPCSPRAGSESAGAPLPLPPPPAAELVVLDSESDGKPARTREDEDRELQEAIMRSLEEGEPADAAAEQARLSEFCVEDDQSLGTVDLGGDNTYRLVGVVSHYGGATHSGHYVSDVYSVGRDRWFHYDDRRVSCVDEADVLGDGHQRNGYIFFYLHKDLCSQVVSAEASLCPP